MRKYIEAYRDVFGSGLVQDETIKKHIEQQVIIDQYLPDSASFFYIVETPLQKYHFFGKQQKSLSGYSNDEFLNNGVNFFFECLHPDEIDIILNQLYPEAMDFVAQKVQKQFNEVVLQYNYRFRKKTGEYINLMEQVYFLETDTSFRPTLLLGNIITLDNTDLLPIRLAIKHYKNKISETIFSKTYTRTKSSIKDITAREMDILRNLAAGQTSKEIGEALFISHHTVDTHRRNLLSKLNCKSVVELTQFAFKNGLL